MRLIEDLTSHLISQTETDGNGCWLWQRGLDRDGYARCDAARSRGLSALAHRALWVLLRGPVPEDLTLDHLCRVRNCLNPDHLEPVTLAENLRRREGKPVSRARKTHCKHGHPFDEANTYVSPTNRRQCRACNRAATARWLARQKESA